MNISVFTTGSELSMHVITQNSVIMPVRKGGSSIANVYANALYKKVTYEERW